MSYTALTDLFFFFLLLFCKHVFLDRLGIGHLEDAVTVHAELHFYGSLAIVKRGALDVPVA